MIMTAADLLARNPDPTDDEIRHAIERQHLPLHGLPEHRRGHPRPPRPRCATGPPTPVSA